MPAHNAAAFIGEAITSVLSQSHKAVEVIVVDDGSTDATAAIVEAFTERVRLIRTHHRGVSAARNAGIDAAKGQLVAFLDADDVWLPRKLEQQIRVLADSPEALVYTGMHVIDSDGHFIGRMDPPRPEVALRNTLLLESPVVSVAQTGLIPRGVIDDVGGFDDRLSTSADCDFACRILMRYQGRVVDQPLVLYRLHEGQMHRDPEATRRDMVRVFEKVFSDARLPDALSGCRNRAYANLYVSLAGAYMIMGTSRRKFWSYLARAFARRPDRVLDALSRLTSPEEAAKTGPVTR